MNAVSEITTASRVGEIAARHPLATRVFARHGIDFCCGGGVAIADACARRGLDTAAVLDEIERTIGEPGAEDATRWDQSPVADLIRFIVERYHAPLREELPRLEAMARKVHRVHGDKDPQRLGALLESYLALKNEVEALQEKIQQAQSSVEESNKKRDELVAENDQLKQAGEELAEAVTAMEAEVRKLYAAVPQPIQEIVAAFVAEHHVERVFFKRKRDRQDPESLARRGYGDHDE